MNIILINILIYFQIINYSFAFYERGDVVELTPTTFKARVLDSNEVWIVEFCMFILLSSLILINFNWLFFCLN